MKREYKVGIASAAGVAAIITAAFLLKNQIRNLFTPASVLQEKEAAEIESFVVEDGVVKTKYFSITLPEGLEDKYAFTWTDFEAPDDEDDWIRDESEIYQEITNVVLSLYEKDAYEQTGQGRLMDIHVNATEPHYDKETDKMLGRITNDNNGKSAFLYVTYPKSEQAVNKEEYENLVSKNGDVLSSLTLAYNYSLYPQQELEYNQRKSMNIKVSGIEDSQMYVMLDDGSSTVIEMGDLPTGNFEVGKWYQMDYDGNFMDNVALQNDIEVIEFKEIETPEEIDITNVMNVYFAIADRDMHSLSRFCRYPITVGTVSIDSPEKLGGIEFPFSEQFVEDVIRTDTDIATMNPSGTVMLGNDDYGIIFENIDGEFLVTNIRDKDIAEFELEEETEDKEEAEDASEDKPEEENIDDSNDDDKTSDDGTDAVIEDASEESKA